MTELQGLRFKRKADLLRRLGKYEKDVRLVDRMMKRGEVIDDGRYYVLPIKEEVKALMEMVLGLCEESEKEGMKEMMYKILYNKGK